MIGLTITAIVFVVGLIGFNRAPYRWETPFLIASILSGAVLFICVLGIPMNRIGIYAEIEEVRAVAETAAAAREAGDDLEGAAFRMEVAKRNAWIANTKYWNQTLFDIWVPDEIDELEPLR